MIVFAYYNMNKAVWSVTALEGSQKGRVILHASEVALMHCTFKVSEAGRQRVLREKRNNIHAGIVGQLAGFLGTPTKAGYDAHEMERLLDGSAMQREAAWHWAEGKRVSYSPYIARKFYLADSDEYKYVISARSCYLSKYCGGMYVNAYQPVLEDADLTLISRRS